MDNFDQAFNSTIAEDTPVVETKKKRSKSNMSALKQAYSQHIAASPEAAAKRGSLRGAIEIVQSLGYGEANGNIIVDRTRKEQSGERVLKGVTKIVGYTVKNVSSAPINMVTEKYVNENGVYVGTPCVETLAPGATMSLSRKYFGLNGVRPEFGESFANGSLVLRTKNQITEMELNEILETSSFRFNPELNIQVNDDSVKVQIGHKEDDGWKVNDEYVETFGFLMNEAPKASKGKKSSGSGNGVSDIEAKAHDIFKMLQSQGVQ